MIPNALGGKLATSDRREKEEIPVKFSSSSPLLPTSTLLTLPQLAPIYSLSRALFLKRELHSLFLGGGFRLRIFGAQDGAAEPPGEVL